MKKNTARRALVASALLLALQAHAQPRDRQHRHGGRAKAGHRRAARRLVHDVYRRRGAAGQVQAAVKEQCARYNAQLES